MDVDRRELLRSYAVRAHALVLSDECLLRIDRYVALLVLWNQRIRLTGASDETLLVERHVADSLAVAPLVPPRGSFVDIGSGAGFPGVVVQTVRDDVRGTLIEPRRRRASFLSEVARTLPLPNVSVRCARAEDPLIRSTEAGLADLVVSRAIRLDAFLPLAAPLLKVGGVAVSMQAINASPTDTHGELGLHPIPVIDYSLPDNSPRRLLLFQRVC